MLKTSKKLLNVSLITCAFVSIALGVIGIFVPLLPTTPFVILAIWLFSKSSDRFYDALLAHKICGPPVQDYVSGRGIKMKYKVSALVFMWLSLLASYLLSFAHPNGWWVRMVLPLVGTYVTYFICSKPTCSNEKKAEELQEESKPSDKEDSEIA